MAFCRLVAYGTLTTELQENLSKASTSCSAKENVVIMKLQVAESKE